MTPSPLLPLRPLIAVTVDLHRALFTGTIPRVDDVKMLRVHRVSPLTVQRQHWMNEAVVQLDLLAQVRGPFLAGLAGPFMHRRQENHQLKVAGRAVKQGCVNGALAVEGVEEGEWEDEERIGLLAQTIRVEVQRGLVQGLTVALGVEDGAHSHIHQGALQQVGGAQHQARLTLVLAHHGAGTELDGSRLLLWTCNLGYESTYKGRTLTKRRFNTVRYVNSGYKV